MTVSVLVPTFRRNEPLARALESLFAQDRTPAEIVVADNAPDAAARPVVEALRGRAPCRLVYVHVPDPGVANARNAGFAAATGRMIAQLDDDESASAGWLSALVDARDRFDAGLVFGPVRSEPPAGAGGLRRAYVARLYARTPDLASGPIGKPFGCGNSLIDRARVALPDPPFDPRANETGGEDDRLFSALIRSGARMAWATGAVVTEHVEPGRARFASLLRRSFAYGQGPSQTAADHGRALETLGWMGVGALQFAAFGVLALPAALGSPQAGASMIDRAAQGTGKLVWAQSLAPRLYGAARLRAGGSA
ncbi:MAG: glycosyltransferase family 2 protein [Oceanicaulis sp.]